MSNLFPDAADAVGTNVSGAIFSDCRKYRYALWRIWDEEKPMVVFIGLNPSTANETEDDPTIRKVKAISKNLGYGGFYMMNLFAIISSDPKILKNTVDCLGDNDRWLNELCTGDIVFAWGNFKEAEERANEIIKRFIKAKALHINKNGSPKHPLYCKSDSILIPFVLNSEQKVQASVATEDDSSTKAG